MCEMQSARADENTVQNNSINVRSNSVKYCHGQPRKDQSNYLKSLMEDYGNSAINRKAFKGQRRINVRDNCIQVVTPQNSVNALIHIF